jgi:hypothetical protein
MNRLPEILTVEENDEMTKVIMHNRGYSVKHFGFVIYGK